MRRQVVRLTGAFLTLTLGIAFRRTAVFVSQLARARRCEQTLLQLDPYEFARAFNAWCERGSVSVRRRKTGTFV
jgi:hypothetical protein